MEQIAAEAAVDVPDEYFDKVLKEYTARRNYIVKALNEIEGVKCPVPGGAFYVIASLPVKNADDFCKWLLEDFSYKGQTVMLAPASGFYANRDLGKDEVRIAYVLNVEDLTSSMVCLKEALKVYPGRIENAISVYAVS